MHNCQRDLPQLLLRSCVAGVSGPVTVAPCVCLPQQAGAALARRVCGRAAVTVARLPASPWPLAQGLRCLALCCRLPRMCALPPASPQLLRWLALCRADIFIARSLMKSRSITPSSCMCSSRRHRGRVQRWNLAVVERANDRRPHKVIPFHCAVKYDTYLLHLLAVI